MASPLCISRSQSRGIHDERSFQLQSLPLIISDINMAGALTLYTREITRGNSCNTIKLLASDIHVRVLETMPFYLSLRLFDDVLTRSETGEGTRCARPWILTASKPWSP